MRWADRGPTPGRTRSASTSRSRPLAEGTAVRFKTAGSKRQLESGRQSEPGRHAAHLLGNGRLDLVRGVGGRRGDQVLEHLAIIADERGINGHSLHLVFA